MRTLHLTGILLLSVLLACSSRPIRAEEGHPQDDRVELASLRLEASRSVLGAAHAVASAGISGDRKALILGRIGVAMIRAGRVQEGLGVLEEAWTPGLDPVPKCAVLSLRAQGYAAAREAKRAETSLGEAMALADKMKAVSERIACLGHVYAGAGPTGAPVGRKAFELARSLALSASAPDDKAISLIAIGDAAAEIGAAEDLDRVINDLMSLPVPAGTESTFVLLLPEQFVGWKACDRAVRLLQREASQEKDDMMRCARLNSMAGDPELARACAAAGQAEAGRAIFATLLAHCGKNVRALHRWRALSDETIKAEADRLCTPTGVEGRGPPISCTPPGESAADSGLTASERDVQAWGRAKDKVQSGAFAEALGIAEKISGPVQRGLAYQSIATALARGGRCAEALDVTARRDFSASFKVQALLTIAESCGDGDKGPQAEAMRKALSGVSAGL